MDAAQLTAKTVTDDCEARGKGPWEAKGRRFLHPLSVV